MKALMAVAVISEAVIKNLLLTAKLFPILQVLGFGLPVPMPLIVTVPGS